MIIIIRHVIIIVIIILTIIMIIIVIIIVIIAIKYQKTGPNIVLPTLCPNIVVIVIIIMIIIVNIECKSNLPRHFPQLRWWTDGLDPACAGFAGDGDGDGDSLFLFIINTCHYTYQSCLIVGRMKVGFVYRPLEALIKKIKNQTDPL